jgi:hypothetical protein
MKMKREVPIDLDIDDVAALFTEEFCGPYSKFEALRVGYVFVRDDGRTFCLTLSPRPEEEPDAPNDLPNGE